VNYSKPDETRVAPDLGLLIDALPNPLLVLDDADHIHLANSAAEDFFQAGKSTLLKTKFIDLMPLASPALNAIADARQSGGVVNEYAISAGTPRYGGERNVDLQAALMHEQPHFVLVMLLERSMAHKIDRQLTHRNAARSVSGMAAMLAHEIKNPLSGIRGAAQLLEPALSSDDRALARLICEETDRIRDLVDRMEVFSDERPPEREPVNIHAVLERVKTLATAGMTQSIPIREEYDPSLPPVMGSRNQLIQVFINLVKNAVEAIEASGSGGEIQLTTAFRPGVRLSIAASGERVTLPLEVCVKDTGPGVPADIRPHLFDPFITTKPNGRGLGLALVAKIVRDHGGIIECEPHDGGTTFRVLLPMLRQTPQAQLEETKA
jgi:two-component system nitrogen regulation sensor histidine kinase GlnL